MEINYIGHSTVELVDGNTRVLIDPFLAPNNPAAKVSADDVDPTHVVITHAHQDHFADAVAVGKRTRASLSRSPSWPTCSTSRASRTSQTPISAVPSSSTGAG